MGLTYGAVAHELLQTNGFAITQNNLVSMLAWMCSEYAPTIPLNERAENNPLDTTESWPNATDFNSAGVKNYVTFADGLAATKATLHNGDYTDILVAFSNSYNPNQTVQVINNSVWGSKPTTDTVRYVQNNYNAVANAIANTTGETVTIASSDESTTSATGTTIEAPIVAGGATPNGFGYYLCDAGGGVYAFGDAKFLGSIPGLVETGKATAPSSPVVDIIVVSNSAYYLVCADGAVYSFGAAQFHGAV